MNRPYVFPRTLRVLSPAARCASPLEMRQAWRSLEQFLRDDSGQRPLQQATEQYFRQMLDVEQVWICGSGKEALYRVFQALKKLANGSAIGMSAYTCPDVACAALKAGFEIIPLEVVEQTLDLDPQSLNSNVLESLAAVVLSNLYGLPDDIDQWRELQKRYGFLLVDDACQALASRRGEERVGATPGSIGVLSFGRGKALSGVGGGAVVLPKGGCGISAEFCDLLRQSNEEISAELPHSGSTSKETLYCLIQWIFGSPYGYRIPVSIPFLGLGATECEPNFELRRLSEPAVIQAVAQLHVLERSAERFVNAAKRWHEALRGLEVLEVFQERGHVFFDGVVPIRYPLLLPDGPRTDRALARLQRQGLGASGSYPATLQGYPELRASLRQRPTPRAESVARRMVTLPVHRFVRNSDMARVADVLGTT